MRNIILSPHIDDDIIGCWSRLSAIHAIYYFFDNTLDRIHEAQRVHKKLGYGTQLHFNCDKSLDNIDFNNCNVFIPSSFDKHYHHKLINRNARYKAIGADSCTLNFYSIDMNKSPQLVVDPDQKKTILGIFESQSQLLTNEKYHLFEDISSTDHIEWTTYEIRKDLTVTTSFPVSLPLVPDNDVHAIAAIIQHKYPMVQLKIKTDNVEYKFI